MNDRRGGGAARHIWAILLVSLAGLLLEVAYTRIVSYKLWYYYSYLVIGLSLLGIGSGGILVAMWAPLRRASTDTIVARGAGIGALTVVVGYWTIARLPMDTVAIWDYGTAASWRNLGALAVVCTALFATFIAIGVIVATLLGRAGDNVGRLYFADLLGAGIGCLVAIPLISRYSPPQVVALAAAVLAIAALACGSRRHWRTAVLGLAAIAVLGGAALDRDVLPDVRPEDSKLPPSPQFFEWGPVFRVDVHQFSADQPNRLLGHDGTYGSGIWGFDGDIDSLSRYETDSRAIPFDVLGEAPAHELIIGSAGGQEILASLYRGAQDIEAVELNPVTVSLLTDHYADFTGHLADRPEVDLHQGDGRTYLARTDETYDLVWYVAPDSYAATNAASSGAFVLSESYLYTTDMIGETLDHLGDDGVMVIQFGELSFEDSPWRTSRYLVTARDALERRGVEDASTHLLVAVERNDGPDLSTIVVKRTPFTSEETRAFVAGLADIPFHSAVHVPGLPPSDHIVSRLAAATTPAEVDDLVAGAPHEIGVVTDDRPFFWHFTDFRDVLADILDPIEDFDPEDAIGERVLLLLLGFSVVYAAAFLLLPFVVARRSAPALPHRLPAAVYFACLGLGFMLFEITMIQRLVRFLGYPTYSLTVTLAAILLSTGVGALLSRHLASRPRQAVVGLLAALAVLAVFYRVGLDPLTDEFQNASLGVRVAVAVVVLTPLGLCLGMFMPLGLGLLGRVRDQAEEYVAWAWAVNGFFSVIGSVLTTILSMALGFRFVQLTAVAAYAVAVVAFLRLERALGPTEPESPPPPLTEALATPVAV